MKSCDVQVKLHTFDMIGHDAEIAVVTATVV